MMQTRACKIATLSFIVALFVAATLLPRRAAAFDVTQALIISGATVGAVTLITVIAIMAADRDEPPFMVPISDAAAVMPAKARGKLHFAPRCRQAGENLTLVCW